MVHNGFPKKEGIMTWLQRRRVKKKVRRMNNSELANRRFELRSWDGNEKHPDFKAYFVDAALWYFCYISIKCTI